MASLILIFSHKMRVFMRDGTIILGLKHQNTKHTDTTDLKVVLKEHADSMKSNSQVLRQSKTMTHNTSVMSNLFQTK